MQTETVHNLPWTRDNIVSTDCSFMEVDSASIDTFNNIDTAIESLCITIACECCNVRSTTYLWNNNNKKPICIFTILILPNEQIANDTILVIAFMILPMKIFPGK